MSSKIYSYYHKRDLLYKIHRQNIYETININKCFVYQKIINKIYPSLTSFIILFDKMSYASRIKKTSDKKLINTFVNIYLTLNKSEFINFFLRLKFINNFHFSFSDTNIQQKPNFIFKINFNVFDEFVFLYQKYLNFFDIHFSLSFINCKNLEEQKLLLNNLNNII